MTKRWSWAFAICIAAMAGFFILGMITQNDFIIALFCIALVAACICLVGVLISAICSLVSKRREKYDISPHDILRVLSSAMLLLSSSKPVQNARCPQAKRASPKWRERLPAARCDRGGRIHFSQVVQCISLYRRWGIALANGSGFLSAWASLAAHAPGSACARFCHHWLCR